LTRSVYFSFHYENDVWRTNVVRNSWVSRGNTAAGFRDNAEFEQVKRGGDRAIDAWIDKQISGTSVTVVCLGSETCNRYWVRREIEKSLARGNGVVIVRIHNIKDQNGELCAPGETDFGLPSDVKLPEYDYVTDNGYDNLGDWVEKSAQIAGRPDLNPPESRYRKHNPWCLR